MFCFLVHLSVIKEAAIPERNTICLVADNMALPSEMRVQPSLTKTAGSNQASPARRASAVLPGVSESGDPGEGGGVPGGRDETARRSLVHCQRRRPSLPVSTALPRWDTQVIDSSIDGPGCESGGYRGDSRRLGTHTVTAEAGRGPWRAGEPLQEDTEPSLPWQVFFEGAQKFADGDCRSTRGVRCARG